MGTIDFNQILNYALRSQLSYIISQPGWYLTERLGWRTPNLLKISIKIAPLSKINSLVEVDDANEIQWIAIRGSSNLENWLLDFEYIQRPFTEIYQGDCSLLDFHRGFHRAADDVCKIIMSHLNRDYKTRITGHSLGGAIAALLTILLAEEGYQIENCITFGQPRVTNKQGAQKLQHLPLLRVINDKDMNGTKKSGNTYQLSSL